MQHNWKTYKLSEITTISNGKSKPNSIGNIPVYGGNGILGYTNNFNSCKEVIIIGRVGAYCGSVYFEDRPIWLSDNAMKAVCLEGFDNKFMYYFLKHLNLNQMAGGSSQPLLTQSTLNEISIIVPPLPEQKAIASILSALDDKIELNLQQNKTLEEMAMALYKHWFVDFGPFKDGKFIDSELGRIPEGWEVKSIGDITECLSKGTTPTKNDLDGLEISIPFLKVRDLSIEGSINETNLELIPELVHLKQLRRSILMTNDILFSIAGTIGRVALVPKTLNNSNCNQALAFIRLNDQNTLLAQIYYFFKFELTQEKINSSIVQGVQANVSLTVLKDMKTVVADEDAYNSFNKKIKPLISLIQKNKEENQILTNHRESLLPKLISGEVRVKNVENKINSIA